MTHAHHLGDEHRLRRHAEAPHLQGGTALLSRSFRGFLAWSSEGSKPAWLSAAALASLFYYRMSMWRRARVNGWWLLGLLAAVVIVVVLATTWSAASDDEARVQLGLASWYGPGFHGEETASGEIFNQNKLVAAHRTLPLGSVIRVTNLENGRRVTLRVIDRGPYGRNFRNGTIVDVSRGAARRLGFIKDGLVPVRLEVISVPE